MRAARRERICAREEVTAAGEGDGERVEIRDGELQAAFLPELALLGCSLRHRGDELLAFPQPLAAYRSLGRATGLPLLFPWANRLGGMGYRCAGVEVSLAGARELIQLDGELPIHGLRPPLLPFEVTRRSPAAIEAEQQGTGSAAVERVFPFPYRLCVRIAVEGAALVVETLLEATGERAVPVSFGYHPYVHLPGAPRDDWLLELPAALRVEVDGRGIPTGARRPVDAQRAPLRGRALDDGFVDLGPQPRLSIAGGGRRITVELLEGYRCAQVFAPAGREHVALEPMTAPADALRSGEGLHFAEPGRPYRARFAIAVAAE